jgi:isopentenyl phosphate kinase
MANSAVVVCLILSIILLNLPLGYGQECHEGNMTFIVKVGGSCLTNKAQKESLNVNMLDWFSRLIAERLESLRPHRYILVHGAGSFGHFTAKEYGLQSLSETPDIQPKEQAYLVEGVAQTRRSVQTLNQRVVASLLSHKVPALGLAPLGLGLVCPSTDETRAEYRAALQRLVATTLDAGMVPVLHGDACLYGPYGAGILGGDTLMELLTADRAIFITDVSGIYTSNPHKDPNATLVEKIEIDEDGTVTTPGVTASGSSHEHDVTGGLAGKLGAAATLAKRSVPVVIVQCGTDNAKQALRGEEVAVGTQVVRRQGTV